MSELLIEVAPREVRDLVYECCRTLGLDGGIADDVARSVTAIEIYFGQGLAAFDEEVQRLAEHGGSLHASPFVRAPDQWRAAEVKLEGGGESEGESEGEVVVWFSPPAPLAALGGVLIDSVERGIGCVPLGTAPDANLPDITGLERFEQVELRVLGPGGSLPEHWQEIRAGVLKHGLLMSADLLERLHQLAATFLVSEAAVNAAWRVLDEPGRDDRQAFDT